MNPLTQTVYNAMLFLLRGYGSFVPLSIYISVVYRASYKYHISPSSHAGKPTAMGGRAYKISTEGTRTETDDNQNIHMPYI